MTARNLRVRNPLGPFPRLYADVTARNLDLELVWIGSVLARGRASSDLVEVRRRDGVVAVGDLFRRGQGDDLAARDDLGPVLTGVRRALGHAARKAVLRG